ncbi:MAG: sigma-70 family RNA polymerase sigma factor [Planctomycetaceae bacterium]|nr:sigma-70 family RNA polymerase sigma factor [Planctomycetaceae bacterium]
MDASPDSSSSYQEDAELLRRVVEERETAAMELLIERFSGLVMGIARQMLSNREDAEEVFQTTFTKLVEKAHLIRNRQTLSAWLFTVAQNESRQLLRNRKRVPVTSSPEILEQTVCTPAQDENQQDLQLLLNEVNQLPEKFQPAIILCCLEGKSREEAARQLGLTSHAVKGRLERGRNLLKKRLLKKGVGLSVLFASWQTNQATAATLVTTTLMQQTVTTCMSSVLLTAGSTAVTTSTLSKGAMFMVMAKSKTIITGAVLALIVVGGGTALYVNSESRNATSFTVVAASANSGQQADGLVVKGLAPNLQELVMKVIAQEMLYQNMEVNSISRAEYHYPLSNPQLGFDVNPDQPTLKWDESIAAVGGDSVQMMPKYTKEEVHGVSQEGMFNVQHNHDETVSVLEINGDEVLSQVYVTRFQEARFLYDGTTLKTTDFNGQQKTTRTRDIEHGCLQPHSLLLLSHHVMRPLSALLAGKKPSENLMLVPQPDWHSRCEVLGEEMVGKEPVVKVRCRSSLPNADVENNLVEYIYLAINKNYIPIKHEAGHQGHPEIHTYEVTSWQEIKPGLWYPKTIVARIESPKPTGEGKFTSMTLKTTYEVISTEPNYPEEYFRAE